ncbi:MAG TPA: hypothetical protein VGT08_21395 [Terracidiphilus sp.]|nr:hypothetical protein [Terracidiphilus sp.]
MDRDLFGKLHFFRDPAYRTLDEFEQAEILPKNTLYYKNKLSAQEGRALWHERATSALSEAGLIFIDQDNGFEIKPNSMAGRTHKYALYSEAAGYYERGKIVIAIQFAAKVKPNDRVEEVRNRLIINGCPADLPVLRGRVTPNILFFTVSHWEHAKKVREALSEFEAKSPVVRGFKRIEMINRSSIPKQI